MTNKRKAQLLSGNETCAEGALAAGLTFFGGYPITPSTEIAEILSQRLPLEDKVFIQMEDEIASIASIIGASMTGAKSMTATSGPGISLMQESIGYGIMVETPCVIVNVMRGGPSTGLPTKVSQGDVMQARWGCHGDHQIIALAPNSVEETFYLTVRAFNLAEKYRTPVILLLDEIIAHMREKVVLPAAEDLEIINRPLPKVPKNWYKPFELTPNDISPMAPIGEGYRYHVTGLTHNESGFPTANLDEINASLKKLNNKITRNKDDINDIETIKLEDANTVILAYGSTARSAEQAVYMLRERRRKVGLMRLKTIWPFPDKIVGEMLKQVNLVLVPELNQGMIIREVERVNRGYARVIGLNRYDGELITPEQIVSKIREVRK